MKAIWGWGAKVTPRPLYPRDRATIPIVQQAGWASGLSGDVWRRENLVSSRGYTAHWNILF